MSVISRRHAPVAGSRVTSIDVSGAPRRIVTGLLLTAAVICLFALLITGVLLAYGFHHSNTIFSGTSVAGVQLGGKSRAQAEKLLEPRLEALASEPVQLVGDGVTLSPTPAELGIEFDADQTARKAYAFGRESSLWIETRQWLNALSTGNKITPVMTVDAEGFAAYLDAHARELVSPPVEPAFASAPDGAIRVEPGRPGVAIDVDETLARFAERIRTGSNEPLEIATVEVAPETSDAQLEATLERAQALTGEPLRLELDGAVWEIGTQDLLEMLEVEPAENAASVAINWDALRRYIQALEPQVFTPGIDASIRNDNGTFTTVAAQPGHKLDVDASLSAAIDALERGESQATLVTDEVQPNITDLHIAEAEAAAQKLNTRPVTLTWDNGNVTLDPATLAKAIHFDIDPSRNPTIRVSFDEAAIGNLLTDVASAVKVEAKNAELRWIDGKVEVRAAGQPGRELDLAGTVTRVEEALSSGAESVAVVTRDVKPEVNADMAAGIQFPDKLAVGQTFYGDSAPDRLHNVELAAARANGAMIPPGGVFSFNQAVGEVTLNSGYRTGYGIIATNGLISTVPSVGGGICQVATTAFHAAFRAGMPIEKRSWHLYWIPRYGSSPSGMKGLDATVDSDYGLDFLFKNPTDQWLAFKTYTDGQNVYFELWGTNPGWEIQIDEPVISNIRPASQEMVYEYSDELPAGKSVFVEHAEDGFDARIHRVVRKDGKVIDEVTLVSTYAPARNVTLVGTR